jgi:hypothetical protein
LANAEIGIISLLLIPFYFLLVILSLLAIQNILISKTNHHLTCISYKHPCLYRSMNWWAVFVHELSHAIIAFLTKNEVKEFKVTSKGGHVIHENSRKSGFFQWLANQAISAAPSLVPPLFAMFFFLKFEYINLSESSIVFNSLEYTYIFSNLYLMQLPVLIETLGSMIINLNLIDINDLIIVIMLIFSFSAATPSSIKKEEYGIQGDLQSIIERFSTYPIFTIYFILLLVVLFWTLVYFNINLLMLIIIFLMLLPIVSLYGLLLNILFTKIVYMADKVPLLVSIGAIFISIVYYIYSPYFLARQSTTNITSLILLVSILKLGSTGKIKRFFSVLCE